MESNLNNSKVTSLIWYYMPPLIISPAAITHASVKRAWGQLSPQILPCKHRCVCLRRCMHSFGAYTSFIHLAHWKVSQCISLQLNRVGIFWFMNWGKLTSPVEVSLSWVYLKTPRKTKLPLMLVNMNLMAGTLCYLEIRFVWLLTALWACTWVAALSLVFRVCARAERRSCS